MIFRILLTCSQPTIVRCKWISLIYLCSFSKCIHFLMLYDFYTGALNFQINRLGHWWAIASGNLNHIYKYKTPISMTSVHCCIVIELLQPKKLFWFPKTIRMRFSQAYFHWNISHHRTIDDEKILPMIWWEFVQWVYFWYFSRNSFIIVVAIHLL